MASAEHGFARLHPDGLLRFEDLALRCAFGRGGIRAASAKQEGDGATPAAAMPLRRLLFRADRARPPRTAVPVEPIAPEDGWCDDPAHRLYNRAVHLPFAASHEVLWREDHLYDIVGVLGWNDAPAERGRGSAIFLHLAWPDWRPTEGCIALAERDLRLLLERGLRGIEVLEG